MPTRSPGHHDTDVADDRSCSGDALRSHVARLEAALDNMSQGLVMFDAMARIVIANARYLEMYGLCAAVVTRGCSLAELIRHRKEMGSFSGDVEQHCAAILQRIAQGETSSVFVDTPDGRTVHLVERPMADGGWVVTHEDVTHRRRAEAQVAHMAHHDALSGLPNRVLFRLRLEQALKWMPPGESLAIHYLDLDHFKTVNDTLGHPVGDDLLKAVADRLSECLGERDVVARLGGDEFAILQADVRKPSDCVALATRLGEAVAAPYLLGDHHVIVGTSIGIAVAPNDGTDPDQLLKNSDMALYGAKSGGRGIHRFFEADMDARMTKRRFLEVDLRKALDLGEFELHYQPLLNLRSAEIGGCEALVRWRHPERGLVSPADFIPIAEETGMINRIGDWVIRTACAEAMAWPGDIKVAVNVSPVQFKSQTLTKVVTGALAASGLAPDRLEIEITETILLRNTDAVLATLHELRAMGVRIAMDDFGTGYSSLSYLRTFPFDKIKIDRSFIKDLVPEGESAALVRAIVGLAESFHMTTTAEGIETLQQQDIVTASGCTEMQGYLFSRPRPASELAELFSAAGAARAKPKRAVA